MVEVEIKFAAPDVQGLKEQIQKLGAIFKTERQERDQYFNAPDRDFGQTDEALRVRHVGESAKITYKGPKRDQVTKTRAEIEAALAGKDQGDQLAQILVCLRYRPSGIVEKQRRVFELSWEQFDTEISLDSVSGLGEFVELEIVADEDHVDAARKALLNLAGQLGLHQSERRSYLELLLARGVK